MASYRASGEGLLPWEALADTDAWHADTRRKADSILADGWVYQSQAPLRLDCPVDWRAVARSNRSWDFALHAWAFAGPLLATYDATGDRRYLDWALERALDWIAQHPTYDLGDGMAWYDMGVGLRAYRLAYLTDAASRAPWVTPSNVNRLHGAVALHFTALANDKQFAAHSNHGLYFAAGQAALARRFPDIPGAPEAARQAARRIRNLLKRQFLSDGVHAEHSPGYHLMILETVRSLTTSGLIADAGTLKHLDVTEATLSRFVMPSGELAQVGDTSRKSLVGTELSRWRTGEMRYIASEGRSGTRPTELATGFLRSGYWTVSADSNGEPEVGTRASSYLVQTCAFHSRVHKHADDLSFVWWERGVEVLVDAGKFGYSGSLARDDPARKAGFFYGHPSRQYVESTKAHNTVEIDGRDFERRDVTPFGSALKSVGESAGCAFSLSHVDHFGSVGHSRALITSPGKWLLVVDWLRDREGTPHDYRQRFAFAPELDVVVDGGAVAVNTKRWEHPMVVESLSDHVVLPVAKGQEAPMLGWTSRFDDEIVATSSTGFASIQSTDSVMVAVFSFEAEKLAESSVVRSDVRWARIEFTAGDERVTVRLRRGRRRVRKISISAHPLETP